MLTFSVKARCRLEGAKVATNSLDGAFAVGERVSVQEFKSLYRL